MIKHINLQLFAGDTTPEIDEEVHIEKEPVNSDIDDEKKETKTKKKPVDDDPFDRLTRGESLRGKPNKELEKKEDKTVVDDKKTETKSDKEKLDAEKESNAKGKDDKKKEEPEFYEIPYMKDKDGKQIKVKIPVTERDTYLQKGFNYDKVKTEKEAANATLKRIAELEGFKTTDEYLAELDKREKAKIAEKIEEAYGDPDKIDEIMRQHPRMKQTEEKEKELAEKERKLSYDRKIESLKKEEFFEELEPELKRMLNDIPGIDPDVAYSLIVGNYYRSGKNKEIKKKQDELIKETKESTEKKVTADYHDKERRATPTGGDSHGNKDMDVQPTQLTKKLASVFGVSAKDIARSAHEKMKRR
jgi:hypothetical protein